jgi:hypothetical protein
MKHDVCYDRLNALVDRELDRFEEGRVLAAIGNDPALEQQACELRLTKDLVRHAYRHQTPATMGGRSVSYRGRGWMAVAAVFLLLVGTAAGWTFHGWNQQDGYEALAGFARSNRARLAAPATGRVVLHVTSSVPDRVVGMLDDAEGMLKAASVTGRTVAVEIVANSAGLDILRVDASRYVARIESLRTDYPNLSLVACGQTADKLRARGIAVQLVPGTAVATSALDQVAKRIQEGWTYVRI